MPRTHPLISGLAVGLVLACVACSRFEPYVYDAKEFDREAPGFGREPTDIDRVEVCYNRSAATPEMILEIAQETCGKFGKDAQFADNRFLVCPLVTPILARFKCVKAPEEAR
jgi:hypothetical protein